MDAADVAADGKGPDAAAVSWWDSWQAGIKQEWSARASVSLATRQLAALTTRSPPEDEADPSRPAATDLSADEWALIMDRVPSCRCARARGGIALACRFLVLPIPPHK